jgi:FkbH-like protein
MTTRRYFEQDIRRFLQDGRFHIVALSAKDKFCDHGLIGAAVVEESFPDWRIDTFLLSCRVIGRKLEHCLLAYIFERARQMGAKYVIGEFIETKKNVPAKEFYLKNGFELWDKQNSRELWRAQANHMYEFPDFIQMKRKPA